MSSPDMTNGSANGYGIEIQRELVASARSLANDLTHRSDVSVSTHPAPTVSGVHQASDWCAPYFPFVPNGDKPHSFRSWPMDLSG